VNGCLRGLLRLGCLVAIAAGLLALWWFREPILRTGARWFGRSQALPPVADTAIGAPTPAALASAHVKVGSLGTAGGPDSIVLTPNEMASLIGSGIDWKVRKTFDSLRVELLDGAFAVHARLDTRALPPDALGPIATLVEPREPLRLGGTLTIDRPGTARFTIREISLRGFAFPRPAVRSVARQMAGADADGAIPLQVDPAVTRVAIHPTGVVLYRAAQGGGAGAPR
jgi:hypothetical protein